MVQIPIRHIIACGSVMWWGKKELKKINFFQDTDKF